MGKNNPIEVIKLTEAFIIDHFDEISKYDGTSFCDLLDENKVDYHTSTWVITEMMTWGVKVEPDSKYKTYLESIRLPSEDDFIININDKFFKYNYNENLFEEAHQKQKIVYYYE